MIQSEETSISIQTTSTESAENSVNDKPISRTKVSSKLRKAIRKINLKEMQTKIDMIKMEAAENVKRINENSKENLAEEKQVLRHFFFNRTAFRNMS